MPGFATPELRHISVLLTVGIDAGLADASPRTGTGRVFHHLLQGLRQRVNLAVDAPRADVWLANAHLPPRPRRAPMVALVHEASWNRPEVRSFLDPRMLSWIEPNTATNVAAATRVVVPSQCSSVDVRDAYGCPADMVHCVPYGVDLDVFTPNARLHPSIAAPAQPYAMFLGTVHPRKNLPLLRAAMAQQARRLCVAPTLALVLTSVLSPDGKRLEAEARAPIPGVRTVCVPSPADKDLAALLARAAVLCLPSAWEGFGFPALEAMACGTPVVVTNRGALPGLVGDAGLIVEPNADALAAAIEATLRDPQKPDRLRRRAEQFSWTRTIDGWEAVLYEAVRG